ncbi:hypothetical protein Tco_0585329 [Tanacetum coccineum]
MYRKWQLSGLPCEHVCAVSRVCGLINCNLWAQPWFMNTTLKDTYRELVYPLKDVSMWEAPNDLQQVLPPRMVKQPAGRPKNTNRILSRGKAPSLDGCTRCGIRGHNQNILNASGLPKSQGTHRQKQMSNKTHMTQEHLTEEALLDEERARNGRIYQDCYDLEAQERKSKGQNAKEPKLEGQQNLFVESLEYYTLKILPRTCVPLKRLSRWEAPMTIATGLQPPRMVKQPAGRPKNTNRILSRGKAPSLDGCTRCGGTAEHKNERDWSRMAGYTRTVMIWKHKSQRHITSEGQTYIHVRTQNVIHCNYLIPRCNGNKVTSWTRIIGCNNSYNLKTTDEHSRKKGIPPTNHTYDPSQPSTSQGYMFHQLKGELSTPYESYHLDDL